MKSIAFIVTLVCCCLMFVVKRQTKAALLVMGAMTLTLVNIPAIPFHWANYLLPMAFLLSEWKHLPQHFRNLRQTPYLKNLLLLVCFSAVVAALTTQYVTAREFLQSELLFKYFALAYAFWAVKDERSLKPVLRISMYCLIVLTVFGVLNNMEESAVFVNALTEDIQSVRYEDVDAGDYYGSSSRFRVQSMFKLAFDYGYICNIILLLHLYAWHRGLENRIPFLIVLGCCLFGIGTCNCRIVWISCVFSISCFYWWCFSLNKTSMFAILAVTAFIFSYSTIETFQEKVDKVTDIFQEEPNTSGSSIEMRTLQLAMTWTYIEDDMFLGLGHGYWADSFENNPSKVAGLEGLESVIFYYLLERGFLGLIIWFAFYTYLFSVFRKNRKKQTLSTGLGASVLVCYFFFATGTGELGSVYPTLLLLGMVIKFVENTKIKNGTSPIGNHNPRL